MKKYITGLSSGFSYAARGICFFYTHPKLWVHAVIPILIMLAIYLSASYYIFSSLLPDFMTLIPNPVDYGAWIRWFIHIIYWVAYIGMTLAFFILFIFTVNSLFDMIGSFFFDRMVACFERYYYGIHTVKISLFTNVKMITHVIFFACVNIFFTILLFFISFIFPIIGALIMAYVMGGRMGLSLMFSSSCNQAVKYKQLKEQVVDDYQVIRGLGFASYLTYCIPFLPLFLAPGLFVGASMLYNEKIQGKIPLNKESKDVVQ